MAKFFLHYQQAKLLDKKFQMKTTWLLDIKSIFMR